MRWPWSFGEQRPPGTGWPPRHLCQRRNAVRGGFQPFLRGKDDGGSGDQIFFQGHAAPGIYARAFLEGRLTEENLDHFRQEALSGVGLSSYPHPRTMPGFWEFPTVSMGLGPLAAIYQARLNRYLTNRGLADTSASHVWAFVGDGEMDEPESVTALSLAAREGLDNLTSSSIAPAAPRRAGTRRRQDHPGTRGPLPRRRLERRQGDLGP